MTDLDDYGTLMYLLRLYERKCDVMSMIYRECLRLGPRSSYVACNGTMSVKVDWIEGECYVQYKEVDEEQTFVMVDDNGGGQ